MARSPGFPDSRSISPSVRVVETDKSFYGADTGFSIPALVGFAAKGPIDTPTKCEDIGALRRAFGTPDPTLGSYLLYAGEQLIQDADHVWIVRVADTEVGSSTEAMTAEVVVPSAGQAAYVQSGITNATPVTVTEGVNDKMRFRVNGLLEDFTITIPAGSYTLTGAGGIRGQINTLLGDDSALVASDYEDSGDYYLRISVSHVHGEDSQIELVSVGDSLYDDLDMGSTMTAAKLTGSVDRWPEGSSLPEFDLGSVSGADLHVVVFGTGGPTIDGVTQVIYLSETDSQSAADVVDVINGDTAYTGSSKNTPLGFFAEVAVVGGEDRIRLTTGEWDPIGMSGHEMTGADAKVVVRSTSTAETHLGLSTTGVSGTSPSGTISEDTSTLAIVNGIATGGDAGGSFTITADSQGTFGDDTEVDVSTDPVSGRITFKVYNRNSYVETLAGMHKDEFASDTTYYIENVVNTTSDYVRVVDNTDTEESPLPGVYSLTGGSNGVPASTSDQAELLVGSEASEAGLYTLSNPEAIDIDVVAIPGVSTTSVLLAMIDFCENQRQDCIAIIDPPLGMTATDVVKWHNGQHYLNLTRLDTSFGATYWPWIQVRDKYNGQDVWVPPSGNVMGAYAITERDFGVWWAPAGAERGALRRVLDVEVVPYLTDRDMLYGGENAVNPIIRRSGGDVMIWGQKSLYRASSALNRINVRRLLLYIRKYLGRVSEDLLFRPHTEILRGEFTELSRTFLENIRLKEGLYSYNVQCDEVLNPPEVIDRNEMRALIGVQPTKAAEYLFVEVVVQNTQGEPETV